RISEQAGSHRRFPNRRFTRAAACSSRSAARLSTTPPQRGQLSKWFTPASSTSLCGTVDVCFHPQPGQRKVIGGNRTGMVKDRCQREGEILKTGESADDGVMSSSA